MIRGNFGERVDNLFNSLKELKISEIILIGQTDFRIDFVLYTCNKSDEYKRTLVSKTEIFTKDGLSIIFEL
jgi:hypothetical protein